MINRGNGSIVLHYMFNVPKSTLLKDSNRIIRENEKKKMRERDRESESGKKTTRTETNTTNRKPPKKRVFHSVASNTFSRFRYAIRSLPDKMDGVCL